MYEKGIAKGGYGKAKTEGYTWEGMLTQYVTFIQENGHAPKAADKKNPESKRLYDWAYNQKRLYNKGNMSQEHIDAFAAAGFPIDGLTVKRFPNAPVRAPKGSKKPKVYVTVPVVDAPERTIRHTKEYLAKREEIYKAAAERKAMRAALHRESVKEFAEGVVAAVSGGDNFANIKSERKKTNAPRKKRERRSFAESLSAYVQFKAEHNGENPRNDRGKEEARLYMWMCRQTICIKNGTISDAHYNALKEAGVDIPNRGNLAERFIADPEWGLRKEDFTMAPGENVSVHVSNYVARVNALARISVHDIPYPKLRKWAMIQLADDGAGMRDWQRRAFEDAGVPIVDIRPRKVRSMGKKNLTKWTVNFVDYEAFLVSHGRIPRKDDSQRLYYWQFEEKRAIRLGRRSKGQIEALERLGIVA